MKYSCSNKNERKYYPLYNPLDFGSATSGDSLLFGTVQLATSQTLPPNVSGAGATNVLYPNGFDTKTFSVNVTGDITIKDSGLYSVELTTVINSTLDSNGGRGHYAIIDGVEADKHGYLTSTATLDAPDNSCAIYSSFTMKFLAGQTVTHRVRANHASDLFVVGTDVSTVYYTNVKVLQLLPSAD